MEILNKLKKLAYYILVLSLSVCTVIRFINWQDNSCPLFVPMIYNSLYFLRKFLALPVLFISELLSFYFLYKNSGEVKKELRKFCVFIFLCVLILLFTRSNKLVYFATMIYFAKDYELNEILDVHIIGKLLVLFVLIYGNISGRVYIAPYQRGNGFGMAHYNMLSQFLLFLLLALSCRFCKDWKRKMGFTLISIMLMLFCIFWIDSRTPTVIIMLFVILIWMEKLFHYLKGNFRKIFDLLFVHSPLLLTIISVILGILIVDYNLRFDQSLGCRFTDFVIAFREVGLSLFSRDLTYGQGNTIGQYYFDNHYAKMIFDYGVVLSCIAYRTFYVANRRAVKFNAFIFIVVLICVFVDGTSGGLFDNELLIVLLACMFSKEVSDAIKAKTGQNL